MLPQLARFSGNLDAKRLVTMVRAKAAQLADATGEDLLQESRALRYRAQSGEPLKKLIPQAYALVYVATERTLGFTPHDVQVKAAIHMSRRCIAELETGEGKTLAATMPLYLFALSGHGSLLATANDYLAQRDAEQMTPLFQMLGMTTGCVQTADKDSQRRKSYACDITYGTASQFAFDLLRDRAKRRESDRLQTTSTRTASSTSQPVGRGHLHSIIVDEADSLLIDEATTPLVIATPAPNMDQRLAAIYGWASDHCVAAQENRDYTYDRNTERIQLTYQGQRWVRSIAKQAELNQVGIIELYEQMELAIKVHRDFHLDDNYVIQNGEVIIVDERTGRLSHSREWQDGIHQAIQSKEGLAITMPYGQMARITIQNFFLGFEHLSGMTGTASQSAKELHKVYQLAVVGIPTHKPIQRRGLKTRVFHSEAEKFSAICQETLEVVQQGRAVLIGTRTIDCSERLSMALEEAGIEHELLNANHTAKEAKLVQQAGHQGSVTIATNMAGRGTDIKLDENVRKAGGLHIIATEIHETKRVDRQLIGRCGRQGDPGSYRQYLCLEDEVLELGFGPEKAENLRRQKVARPEVFQRAQTLITRKRETNRYAMLHQEKSKLTSLWRSGLDPMLDVV